MLTQSRDLKTGRTPWDEALGTPLAALPSDITTEVLVIGAGITGALVAEALAARRRVIVIDRRGVARGSTAASTALVCHEIDTPLTLLARQIGDDRATRAWQRAYRSTAALAQRTVELGFACGFAWRDSLTIAGDTLDAEGIAAEAKARLAAAIPAETVDQGQLQARYGIVRSAGLLSHGDFIVDPRAFAVGYLQAAVANGTRILAPVDATDIVAANGRLVVATAGGPQISADFVVCCTGYELPRWVRAKGHRIVSTYAMATAPQRDRTPALHALAMEASDPYLYLRDLPGGGLVCGGEDEPVADPVARDALLPAKVTTLRGKLSALLPGVDTLPVNAWAGTFGESDTGLPSISPVPGLPSCWAVLGFGGNGMVHARIASEIVAAAVAGRRDPDADLYARL